MEQFTKGNRPELAEKERVEITLIEGYMPKAASEDDLRALVAGGRRADNEGQWRDASGAEGYGRGDEGRAAAEPGGWGEGGWEDVE